MRPDEMDTAVKKATNALRPQAIGWAAALCALALAAPASASASEPSSPKVRFAAGPGKTLPRLSRKESDRRIAAPPPQVEAAARAEEDAADDQPLDILVSAEGELSVTKAKPGKRQRAEESSADLAEELDALPGRSEAELARTLISVAQRGELSSEAARQAYLRSVDRLRSDAARVRALQALLTHAATTVETGRGVLRSASRLKSDEALLDVLEAMHRISESDLVRKPLASLYLDVAERLRSGPALASALRSQLHPLQVPKAVTLRALKLLGRVQEDDARRAVLTEVTDHQAIDADVEVAYRASASGLEDAALQQDALAALDAAMSAGREDCAQGGRRTLVRSPNGDGYRVRVQEAGCGDSGAVASADEDLAAEVQRLRQERQQLREQTEELGRKAQALGAQLGDDLESADEPKVAADQEE